MNCKTPKHHNSSLPVGEQGSPEMPTAPADLARRRFLAGLGLAGAAFSTASLTLVDIKPANAAASADNRWGMLIDTAKCASGCDSCVTACNEEHGLKTDHPDTDAQWIRKVDLKDNLTGVESSLPVMCQHCDSAPCVDVCPTGASFKRVDGIVLVNKHTCIGCRYCVMACPYKARSFIHETLTEQRSWAPRGKGTVEACTLCVHRRDAGMDNTACSQACTEAGHNAIVVGDLNDPASSISQALVEKGGVQIRADLELNTGVRYTRI